MTRTKKIYTNKGGKVIASGGYGCVFNPALKCEGATKRESNKISKLMTDRHATEEYEQINEIKHKLDSIKDYRNYFLIYDATLCRPAKLSASDLTSYTSKCSALPKDNITKTNINTKLKDVLSLNIPNGGLPVDDFIYANGGYDKLYKIHLALVNLLKKGIIPMNKKNIYHSDIKDSNIVVDHNIKARLIDWGLTVEYTPNSKEPFPKNWKNRPLQFNVPFSVILFTETFYENYSKYLKEGGELTEATLRPFVISYLNEWIKERGAGHYKFINEIMFLLYNNTLINVPESSKPSIVETEITMPYIINYIIDILQHFTKFKKDGSLNLREYLNDVYIKIVDIWGFIMVYYPMLEMFSNNYATLNQYELKIFKQIQYIFNEYLYTPRHEPINMNQLLNDLNILGDLIKLSHQKTLSTSVQNIHSLDHTSLNHNSLDHTSLNHNSLDHTSLARAKGTRTRKNTKSSTFKRKKFVKRFKKSFFLSLK
jgi:hypothetical protein